MGEFDYNLFLENLWKRENMKGFLGIEGKGGYYNGTFHPYKATAGIDVGPGFLAKNLPPTLQGKAATIGLTKEELDSMVKDSVDTFLPIIKDRIVEYGGNPNTLSNEALNGMLDMRWQLGNNGFKKYKEFWKAAARGDYKGMREHSRTTYIDDKTKKRVPDTGRWDFRKETYFQTPLPETIKSPEEIKVPKIDFKDTEYKFPIEHSEGGFLQPKDEWDKLSMAAKAEMMKVAVNHGIYDLQTIRQKYNEFAGGGSVNEDEEVSTNEFGSGGSIHIKPENRGKFTALKKRTGHSASWFKEHGTPAQKKMATFAINAVKWKHGLGGNLFEGTSQPTQKMQIGLDVQGWPDYTTQQIIAYGEENERRRKAIQDAYLNFVTESNDATAVANGRSQNQHLVDRAVRGAKANAAWEKEHPNLTAWGNTLATIPFIGASAPALDAAASTAMGQSVLSGINYIANAAKATPYISEVLPWAEAALATGSATHGIHEMKKGTFTPITALEVSPLAPPVIGIGNNLYLPHLREHLYASKAPIGYDGILPAAKRMAEGILSGRRADIESPFWFNSESAKTLGESYAFVPTKIPEAEKAQYIKEFGQKALKARADIWRMYNRLPQKYNTFVENDRYPGAYTATEDIKALKWVPFPDKNVDPGDFVNSVGGNVGLPQITHLGKGLPDAGYTSKEFGITTLSDLWDLYPFSRPNDRLISRIQRGYQKAFNSTETPKLNWLKPLDKKLANFEVGKLVNAKPIMVKNDIPWTMDRKLITDANGNLNFRTSYTQGFHSDNVLPQSVIDWKTGKPLIEEADIRFNPEDYNFLEMKLTTKSRKK